MKKKKLMIALLLTVITITSIPNQIFASETSTTVTYGGREQYHYVSEGSEYILGPYFTVYFKTYYNEKGEMYLAEMVREVDDFVLETAYSATEVVKHSVPELTEKQKSDFIAKYGTWDSKQKEKEDKAREALGLTKKMTVTEVKNPILKLIEKNLIEVFKKEKYAILTYKEITEEMTNYVSDDLVYFTSGINVNPRPYENGTAEIEKYIRTKLDEASLDQPITVHIVPYEGFGGKRANGFCLYRNQIIFDKARGMDFIIFNSSTVSMKEQFDTRFTEYVKEMDYYRANPE